MSNKLVALQAGINREAMHEQIGNFPIDVLPAGMQKLVLDIVRQENYPLDFTVVSMLSAAASAIGNAYQIRIKGQWTTSPILYVMLVGKPGVGKTPPLDFAYQPIQDEDSRRYAKYIDELEQYERDYKIFKTKLRDGEIAEEPIRPILVRQLISDFTPEAMLRAHNSNLRGITIFVDEIMGMFGSANRYSSGQLIEQLLSAHSGKPLDVMRCGQPMPFHIKKSCINIVGTTQTYRIKELLSAGHLDNGMMDRFLFAFTPNRKIGRWLLNAQTSHEPKRIWTNIIDTFMHLPCEVDSANHCAVSRILDWSPEAKERFFSWRNDIAEEIDAVNDESQRDTRFAKDPANFARLALLMQLLRWAFNEADKDCVDIVSIEAALKLGEYFTESYEQLIEIVSTETVENTAFDDWFGALADEFKTADAIATAKQFNISIRTAKRRLKQWCNENKITKVKHGEYSKNVNATNVALDTFGTLSQS
jgi:hypothetical protein